MNATCSDFTVKVNNTERQLADDEIAAKNHVSGQPLPGSLTVADTSATRVAGDRWYAVRRRLGIVLDRILTMLDSLIGALSSSRMVLYARVFLCVLAVFAIIGVIGGIESGLLGFGQGIAVVVIAVAVEFICLRGCR